MIVVNFLSILMIGDYVYDQAYGWSNYGPANHPEVLQQLGHWDPHLRYVCNELPANYWNLLMIKVNLIEQVGIHGSEERIANYSR